MDDWMDEWMVGMNYRKRKEKETHIVARGYIPSEMVSY